MSHTVVFVTKGSLQGYALSGFARWNIGQEHGKLHVNLRGENPEKGSHSFLAGFAPSCFFHATIFVLYQLFCQRAGSLLGIKRFFAMKTTRHDSVHDHSDSFPTKNQQVVSARLRLGSSHLLHPTGLWTPDFRPTALRTTLTAQKTD